MIQVNQITTGVVIPVSRPLLQGLSKVYGGDIKGDGVLLDTPFGSKDWTQAYRQWKAEMLAWANH